MRAAGFASIANDAWTPLHGDPLWVVVGTV
jgi:hypothetical protein